MSIDKVLLRLAKSESTVATAEAGQHLYLATFDAAKNLIQRNSDRAHLLGVRSFLDGYRSTIDYRTNENGRDVPIFLAHWSISCTLARPHSRGSQAEHG